MGNTSPSQTNTVSLSKSSVTTPVTPRSTVGRRFSIATFNTPISIYNEILKDAQKLRLLDKKLNYNPHRRVSSIQSNLPSSLQHYSNSMHIVNEFWLNFIQPLPENELNEIAMVCYCRLYLKSKNIRNILLASHGMKVFNVFGYVIRNLLNPENHFKLFKQLQVLGEMHANYSLNNEIYDLFIQAFNYAMEEKFETDYKIRTRFCFGQLYRVIVDIMTGDDFYAFTTRLMSQSVQNNKPFSPITRLKRFSATHRNAADKPIIHVPLHGADTSSSEFIDDEELNRMQSPHSKKKKVSFHHMHTQIDGFLGSLEECLSDEIGSLYFKKYLEEQFCVENVLFHEYVLKYKAAKSSQRIKLGSEIISEFVRIGAEKEVNLSYNTRKQILTIINLVHKMNQNKEKYQQIYKNHKSQIISEEDIKYLNNENDDVHYRMATTKKLPLELFEITNLQNTDLDIPDLIYSMGFTANLFDQAYDEIFNLMRVNFWSNFRNAILEFVDDDEFAKLQNEKLLKRKEQQRDNLGMIQAINSIQKTMHNHNNPAEPNESPSLLHMLSRSDSTHSTHRRRKSKDDFDVIYQNIQANHSCGNNMPRHGNTLSSKFSQLTHLTSLCDTDEQNIESCDSESENEQPLLIAEDREVTLKMKAFKKREKPRLSFIPSLMPSIEKSATSPTAKSGKMGSGFDTPNGGAAVVQRIDANAEDISSQLFVDNKGNYSPSELFNLVSETIPWDYSNNVKATHYSGIVKGNSKQTEHGHEVKSVAAAGKRKSVKHYNKQIPLYAQKRKSVKNQNLCARKKRKSKLKTAKQPMAKFCNTQSI